MAENYKIKLGVKLDTSDLGTQIDKIDDKHKVKLGVDLKVNDIRERISQYNKNTNNAKLKLGIKLDTDDLNKQIKKLNIGGTDKKGVGIPINTQSLEDSLKEVKGIITDIRNVIGTLDDKSGIKDLVSSINQMAKALGKAENESDSLVKSLSALSKKDFSLNLGLNLGSSNPIGRNAAYGNKVRSETLPQLKQQMNALVKVYSDTYKESVDEISALQKLVSGTKLADGDFFQNFLIGDNSVLVRMNSGSLASQMQAYKQYIDMFKQAASLKGLDLTPVISGFSKTSDELIKEAQDIQTGANEMQNGFEKIRSLIGSGIDADSLGQELKPIIDNLRDIKIALQDLSKGVSVDGLTQSFNKLSETLDRLMANAKLVQDVLGNGLGDNISNVATTSNNETERAIQDQKELAQISTQSTNIIVQNEERKQQTNQETANKIKIQVRATSENIENLQRALYNFGFNSSSIESIINDIKQVGFEVEGITHQLNDDGSIKITVKGVDDLQRAVTSIKSVRMVNNPLGGEKIPEIKSTTKISQSLKESDKFIKQQKRNVADLTNQINQLNRAANDQNASKPIKDSSHLDTLSSKYNEIISAIQKMGNASSNAFNDEQIKVKELISNYKSLVKEYKNAESVATSLRSKDVDTSKEIYSSKLDVLISKMNKDGVYTSGFKNGAENLRSILSDATDSNGITRFLNGLDKLEAGYKRASASVKEFNQSQKVGINTSGLESKIADIQRISPEIDKFETEIDGAKVSVQSLLNDLKQIKTQGDFSVVNARFKAFSDSAKAAGIAVSETVIKVNSVKKIKDKLADTGFNGFEQEVRRAHIEAEKLEGSTIELEKAFESLDNAMKSVYSANQSGNVKQLVTANEEYETALKRVYSQIKLNQQAEKQSYDAEVLSQKKASLSSDMEIWLKENTRATKDFGEEIRRLQASLDGLDANGVKLVGQQFKNITKQAKVLGKDGLTVFDKLKSKAKEYMAYLSAAELFMYAEQAMRAMFNTVKEIDTAMTGLYRVTDLTAAEYDTLFNNMISSAKEYGATLNDIINATTDWVRAGFDANTSLGLAEVTTMYQHISDLDYDTAAENLITAYNGFKDELNGAFGGDTVASVKYIADIFNELDK